MARRPVGGSFRWDHERLQRAMKKAKVDAESLRLTLLGRGLNVRVKQLQAGGMIPQLETAREVADILGVSLDYLVPKRKRA